MTTIFGQALFGVGIFAKESEEGKTEFPVREHVTLSTTIQKTKVRSVTKKAKKPNCQETRPFKGRAIAEKICETDMALKDAYLASKLRK